MKKKAIRILLLVSATSALEWVVWKLSAGSAGNIIYGFLFLSLFAAGALWASEKLKKPRI